MELNRKNKGFYQGPGMFDEASYYMGSNFEIGGNDRRSASKGSETFPLNRGLGSIAFGMIRADENIEDDVWKIVSQSRRSLDLGTLEVSVRHGVIKLSGSVSSLKEKREIENSLEHIPGVVDIQNEMTIYKALP